MNDMKDTKDGKNGKVTGRLVAPLTEDWHSENTPEGDLVSFGSPNSGSGFYARSAKDARIAVNRNNNRSKPHSIEDGPAPVLVKEVDVSGSGFHETKRIVRDVYCVNGWEYLEYRGRSNEKDPRNPKGSYVFWLQRSDGHWRPQASGGGDGQKQFSLTVDHLIKELESIKAAHGDMRVEFQQTPRDDDEAIMCESVMFAIPEKYDDDGLGNKDVWICNLRAWPY